MSSNFESVNFNKTLRINLIMYSYQNIRTPFVLRPNGSFLELKQSIVNHVLNKFGKDFNLTETKLHLFLENGRDLLSAKALHENIDNIDCIYNDCRVYICTKAQSFTLPVLHQKHQQKTQKIVLKSLKSNAIQLVTGRKQKNLNIFKNALGISYVIPVIPRAMKSLYLSVAN